MTIPPFYGQRLEDKTIVDLLGGESEHGFFCDAGAWEPDFESVSRHFYEQGWAGINIEPNPYYYSLLVEKRPRDFNICCALSNEIRTMDMTLVEGSGLSTLDPECGAEAAKKFPSRKVTVPVFTLAWIFENFLPVGREISWLKLDTENWEEWVLRGNDWDIFRPRIVCVEATIPATETPNYEAWESVLLDARYEFVVTDNLNRFYRRIDGRTWGLTYPLKSVGAVASTLDYAANEAKRALGISVAP